jgi:hypothetical protein
MKCSKAVGVVLAGIIGSLGSLQGAIRPPDSDCQGEPVATPPVRTHLFEDRSTGWYWVYESVAQAQSFRALGSDIGAIRLRVAQLNEQVPTAPLEIEVRSGDLQKVYLRGSISPEDATLKFQWSAAKLEHKAPLEEGQSYVLLLHSRETHHDTPWLVGAAFRNAFPDGRHLGYPDDLMFSIEFTRCINLVVGPPLNARPEYPIGSGRKGGKAMPTAPALRSASWAQSREARFDPLGPIPAGEKVLPRVSTRAR